jgi:hypothetical protein
MQTSDYRRGKYRLLNQIYLVLDVFRAIVRRFFHKRGRAMRYAFVSVGILFASSAAHAQFGGYTIRRPGQLPSQMTPNGMGGYSVQTPGQLPTQINPTFPCMGYGCR